jgi:hypothetical protein
MDRHKRERGCIREIVNIHLLTRLQLRNGRFPRGFSNAQVALEIDS